MRPSSLLFYTLLVTATASSQQTSPLSAPVISGNQALQSAADATAVTFSWLRPGTCPMGMDVHLSSSAALSRAERARPAQGPVQRLDVKLRNTDLRDVISLDAHVQGISAVPRFLPTNEFAIPTNEFVIPKTRAMPAPVPFHSDRRMSAGAELSLLWTLANATGVEWVQLDRITYADGSTWQRRGSDACKVAPNGLMPVN
jgi:hypothetical protein